MFVLVDRNAIAENDKTGSDRPPIVVHPAIAVCRELEILDAQGQVVARFMSQSRRRNVTRDRPHVWLEIEAGSVRPVK